MTRTSTGTGRSRLNQVVVEPESPLEASVGTWAVLAARATQLLPTARVVRAIVRVTFAAPIQSDDHTDNQRHQNEKQKPPHLARSVH